MPEAATISQVELVLHIAEFLALVAGAAWVYFRFWREGVHRPAIEFDISSKFLGPHNEDYAVEISTFADNKGRVEHRFSEIRLRVRAVSRSDVLVSWPGHEPRASFPVSVFDDLNLVPRELGYFFVRPGVRQRFTLTVPISTKLRFVSVRATFKYESGDIHSAERVFEVPGAVAV